MIYWICVALDIWGNWSWTSRCRWESSCTTRMTTCPLLSTTPFTSIRRVMATSFLWAPRWLAIWPSTLATTTMTWSFRPLTRIMTRTSRIVRLLTMAAGGSRTVTLCAWRAKTRLGASGSNLMWPVPTTLTLRWWSSQRLVHVARLLLFNQN